MSRWTERWALSVAILLASIGASSARGAEPSHIEPSHAEPSHAEPSPAGSNGDDAEESLVRYALAHNPELRAARWGEGVASAEVTRAAALSNPVLRGEWLHVQAPETYGFGVGLEWTPPRPGVYSAHENQALAEARAVREDLGESAADLEAQVRSSCARIEALARKVALAEASVHNRSAIHEASQERVLRGAASRIDLSLVTVSLLRAEQERDQLRLDRSTALAQLEALLGLPASGSSDRPLEASLRATLNELARAPSDTPAPATSEPPAPATSDTPAPDGEPAAEHGLIERALAARPIVRGDQARAEAARELVAAEDAKRWPWFAVQGRYRRHDQSVYANDITLGVQVELPLLDRNGGAIAEATALESQRRDLATAHHDEIVQQVRALLAESRRRAELADHYAQAMAPVLQEHAVLVRAALAGLELDLMAVLGAEDMITRGAIEYVDARLAERQTNIALARALGAFGRARVREGK